jgi:hypothetical protein
MALARGLAGRWPMQGSSDAFRVGGGLIREPVRWLAVLCLGLGLAAGAGACTKRAEDRPSVHSQGAPADEIARESDSAPVERSSAGANGIGGLDAASVRVRDGTLSVSLEESELPDVMAAIAEQSGIEIQVTGLEEPIRLTDSFSELPVEAGLRRLLSDLAATFVYSDAEPEPRLKRVLVMPHRAGEPDESVAATEVQLAALRESREGEPVSAGDELIGLFHGASDARGGTATSGVRGQTAQPGEPDESGDSSAQSALDLLFGTSGRSQAPDSAPEQPVPPSAQDRIGPGREPDPSAGGGEPDEANPQSELDLFLALFGGPEAPDSAPQQPAPAEHLDFLKFLGLVDAPPPDSSPE